MVQSILVPEDIDESISAFRAALNRTWHSFCHTSSIHGLKYSKDEETNKYIRFIWMLITLVMLICAVAMVYTFYVDYRSNPTRMNVENDYAPTVNLLFPPVTICAEVMYNMQNSKKFVKTLILPNETLAKDVLGLLDSIYGFMFEMPYNKSRLDILEEILRLNNLSITHFMGEISWKCNDLLYKCRYKDSMIPCGDLFQISHTFRGNCCSFNLNQTHLNFTQRHAHSGLRNGLSIMLYYNDSIFDSIRSYSHGFRLLIQQTNAYPSAHSKIKFLPLNHEVFVNIRPVETFCSQAVKDLDLEDRNCVLPYEKELTFFRSYAGANCDLNCRISKMIEYCDCYTYFFFSNRTRNRLCTFKDIPCLVDNFANIIGRYRETQCFCYRNCEKIEYNVQVTSAPLDLDTPTINSFYDGLNKNFSVVHIYISSQVYRRVRHDLLSNMVLLVSNLGSAFSLFVGMSMISVVEIVYFFSIILNKYYQQECQARKLLIKQRRKGEKRLNKTTVKLKDFKYRKCFKLNIQIATK